jgi:hypothetical protein
MKLIPAVCICLLMLSVSCKKSNDQPNTPPPVTDTTKSPVVKADTSTLLKSMLTYYYDASGTAVADSSFMEWKYDNQRRTAQLITVFGTSMDTLFYTYSNNGYTTDDRVYNNGSLSRTQHAIYYQHLPNRTDSVIKEGGVSLYYYYNQFGQDSLEKQVYGVGNPNPTIEIINYYYTGQNLDSTIDRQNGLLYGIYYYTNGNMTGSNLYTLDANNILETIDHYTYTNIPLGGLKIYVTGSTLMSGVAITNVSNGTISVETNTYQLDAANRITQLTANNNQPYFQKSFFSYY